MSFRRARRFSTRSGSWRRRGEAQDARCALSHGLLETLVDRVPVDDVPPRADVIGPAVLVLEVIRVLPHVEAEDRLLAFHQRTVLVRRALDDQLAACVDQPGPAAAEAGHASLRELLLEAVERAE